MNTAGGTRAAEITRWAWDDPPNRVQQAIAQVDDLARSASGPDELAEIQDSGTMLSRLASSFEPAVAMATITGQLSGGEGIIGQILDMAKGGGWHDAWRTERRGPHGEWTGGGNGRAQGGGTVSRARAERIRNLQESRIQRMVQAEVARQLKSQAVPAERAGAPPDVNKAANIAAQAKADVAAASGMSEKDVASALAKIPELPGETKEAHMGELPGETARENLLHEQLIHQHIAPILEAKAQDMLTQAKAHIERRLKEADAADTAEGNKKARQKAVTEGSIAIGAAVLAIGLASMGVPALIAILASAVLPLVQIGIEFRKQL